MTATKAKTLGQHVKGVLKKVLLLAFSLLVCLVIVEIFLRWSMDYKPDLGAYVVDFEIGKRLKPGWEGDHYGAHIKINSAGMRDREFDRKKPEGTLRILVLGDSWTFGTGVTTEETWPKRLEAALASWPRPVEVMNTGVSGYETHHESICYERDLKRFEHDLVLVGMYPVNDVHAKDRRYAKYKRLHDLHPLLYEAYVWPKQHLYIAHWYKQWRQDRKRRRRAAHYAEQIATDDDEAFEDGGFAPGEDDWTDLYNDQNRGWRLMKEALASIGETAAACDAEAAVVLFPDLRDLARYEAYCHPKVGPLIAKAVEDAGLGLIDLDRDFAAYQGREADIALGGNAGATHPNAKGYDLIGRAVAREIEARGLLPR